MIRRTGLALRRTAAIATASLAVSLAAGAPAVGAPGAPPQTDGADLVALTVRAGQLQMSFRGSGQAGADPQSLRFTTSSAPAGVIPDDPAFAFLGRPGAPVWSLQDGSPFSTFDTTAIGKDAVAGGAVDLQLASVDGPGSFAAYTLSEWGRPTPLLDSDGQAGARLPAGKRLGGVVWLFDAAGEYRVTLRATARAGARTLKDEATYHVTVAETAAEAPAAAPETTAQAAGPAAVPRAAAPSPAPASTTGLRTPAGAQAQAAATTSSGRKVISDGHVDMGPQLGGSTLTVKLKDDATNPPTWRDLADVVLKVTDKALIDVPSGAGYAFLGKAGDKVHLLPQSQQSGIVWPGWNTQHESMVKGTRGNVIWRLKQVSGPGEFKLFLTGSFGTPEVIFDSAKKLPQQLAVAPNTHAHGNWAFTKPGSYQLSVEMSATTTAGKTVSDTRTLSIAVGDSAGDGGASTGDGKDGSEGTGTDPGTGTGTGTGEGTGEGSGKGGGNLAKTGVNIVSIAGGGVLLLAAGAAAVLGTRRRRGEPGHVSTEDLPNENENH